MTGKFCYSSINRSLLFVSINKRSAAMETGMIISYKIFKV